MLAAWAGLATRIRCEMPKAKVVGGVLLDHLRRSDATVAYKLAKPGKCDLQLLRFRPLGCKQALLHMLRMSRLGMKEQPFNWSARRMRGQIKLDEPEEQLAVGSRDRKPDEAGIGAGRSDCVLMCRIEP